jgi:hypothetical protein
MLRQLTVTGVADDRSEDYVKDISIAILSISGLLITLLLGFVGTGKTKPPFVLTSSIVLLVSSVHLQTTARRMAANQGKKGADQVSSMTSWP